MSHSLPASKFFTVGGTLRPDDPSYVERPMDEELLKLILAGQFCYVLTARQMGKSSLMARTATRLKKQGVNTAIIDLTQIGLVTIEQWYLGLLTRLKRQFRLLVDPETWWQEQAALGPVQRFIDFLHEVVLKEIEGQVVIFIDEIDFTLKLDPTDTDDFFAAIRAVYNARADEEAFKRLAFVLLGVATPPDLIKDRTRTPFNIGHAIALQEFSQSEATVLQAGLESTHPDGGKRIFERIYHWTNGHPYLTQKLCLAVAERKEGIWYDWQVDGLVKTLFLLEEARKEVNLQSVHEGILDSPNHRQLLTIYRQIYQGREVLDDERSQEKNTLKLVGLVKSEHGHLEVRNEIYRQVFDLEWIKANIVVDWTRRLAIITTLVALVLALTLGGYVWWQAEAPARAYEANFTSTSNPTLRLNALANLFTLPEYGSQARAVLGLPGYDDRARTLFKGLSLEQEIELFTRATPDLQPQVREVVRGTYTYLEDTEANNRLLQAMQAALNQSEDAESRVLANEIARWLAGRTAATLEEKKSAYSDAINWNDENPAIYFERALILTALNDNEGALTDFETVLGLDSDNEWNERVQQAIEGNAQLYSTLWRERATYPDLVGVVPTPTPTSTSIPQQLPTISIPTPFQVPDISVPTIPRILLTSIPEPLPDYLLTPSFLGTPILAPDLHPIVTPILVPDLPPISTSIRIPDLHPIVTPIRVPGSGPISTPVPTPAEPAPSFSVPP